MLETAVELATGRGVRPEWRRELATAAARNPSGPPQTMRGRVYSGDPRSSPQRFAPSRARRVSGGRQLHLLSGVGHPMPRVVGRRQRRAPTCCSGKSRNSHSTVRSWWSVGHRGRRSPARRSKSLPAATGANGEVRAERDVARFGERQIAARDARCCVMEARSSRLSAQKPVCPDPRPSPGYEPKWPMMNHRHPVRGASADTHAAWLRMNRHRPISRRAESRCGTSR